jgi:1,2-diacylglycerol 3-alpha-glucosyltransferase
LVVVIWIDWYAYHVSRFRALIDNELLKRDVTGIEMVGGCGVHTGLRFRDDDRLGLPIASLIPSGNWNEVRQLTLARALWRKLNELRPSSVLVPGWYTIPALAAALWAKLHRKRSILMSETTREDYTRVWWKEIPKRVLINSLFDYGIAGGKPHRRYLMQLGFPQDRIGLFYDVVDNAFYHEATERTRSSATRDEIDLPKNYFLYVGRFAPEKNLRTLIGAFAAYRQCGGTWSLVLVGDGPDREDLIRLTQASAIQEYVLFTGLKTTKETIPFYAFARCFVLPSVREPWGLVVNEAMASGLPVIVSSNCGCAEDLVESGGNGFLFDPLREDELTDRMVAISESRSSVVDAMGRRSIEIIAGFSPQHWAAEVARVVTAGLPA